MNIDPGLAIVIVAVLIFYLRLIIIQRERAKRISRANISTTKKRGKEIETTPPPVYSILSSNTTDRVIAGVGVLAVVAGILLNTTALPFPVAQPYWWIPTALGVIAFSWAFKL